MQEGVAGGRPGWLMACRELFRKSMPDEAMPLVARGYDDGYTCDADLYKSVIGELCKAALTQRALEELGKMETLGYTPTPVSRVVGTRIFSA
jgi:hypothetical protein